MSVIIYYWVSASCRNVTLNLADNLIAVAGYQSPAVEGTNVTFTCSPGLELTGSSISTCTGNGEWEPDPMDINCSSNEMLSIVITHRLSVQ